MADQQAIGVIETMGLVGALAAADAAAKAAGVKVVRRVAMKGSPLTTILYEGDVAAVAAAMEAGAAEARRVGQLISVHLIPRPAAGLEKMTGGAATPPPATTRRKKTDPAGA
ncbi:MAG: BMC domain-containing protein [Fimbriimonadaceae bacterium]|nr:BMC domain-containing protein [Fimbriimonadaceae bacterium]